MREDTNQNQYPVSTGPLRLPDGTVCPVCNGTGMLVAADRDGNPKKDGRLNKIIPCQCQSEEQRRRQQIRLRNIDGLTVSERQLRFDTLTDNANGSIAATVRQAAINRRGMITLSGAPGTGKTTLLVCAVNEARERGVPAVYTTVTDLLDYLRQAYNPNQTGPTIDQRWNLLETAQVLALDELDEFNATDWAMERFLRLVDERWRAMDRCLTLCATNNGLASLPAKVSSRMRDGRADVFEMTGVDMRPHLGW